ncbi:MAG: GGDEF domain-containing protein [Tissierella sp.]|nr:GGDEF domain-containing protein [Tissierella sp.]
MYKVDDENRDIIRIVLDKKYNIKYTNVDNKIATSYIEKLKVLYKISEELPVHYDLEDCSISIDEVNIHGSIYYWINVVIKFLKCINCNKLLTDAVTGLYNRDYWERIINNKNFDFVDKNFTLIIMDIDDLKQLNDIYGHLMGDKAIGIVGQSIKKAIRKDDIGLRYGGDEFIVVLFNQDKEVAYKVIERIKSEIKELAAKYSLSIQISIGVASNTSMKSIEDVIKKADIDLYKEKNAKKQIRMEKDDFKIKVSKLIKELNKIVIDQNKMNIDEEVIEISRKLGELNIRYLNEQ